MNKNKNKILVSLLVLVLFFTGFLFLKNRQIVTLKEGEKQIEIIVVDEEDKVISKESYITEKDLLGDLLDEINEKNSQEIFIFDGLKSSEFGRFITDISYIEKLATDFWVYDSENNEVCLKEAFCPGVDLLAIGHEDSFKFNLLKP